MDSPKSMYWKRRKATKESVEVSILGETTKQKGEEKMELGSHLDVEARSLHAVLMRA